MQNELHVLVSVDLTVPALMDVQSMRKVERILELALFLPFTVMVGRLSRDLALEEGELVCRYFRLDRRMTSMF